MAAELAFTVVRAPETTATAVAAIASGELWTCGADGRLAISRDQGATWISLATGTDVDLNGVVRARDGAVWVVGHKGFATRIVEGRPERVALGTAVDLTGVHALDDEIVILAADGTIRRLRGGSVDVIQTGVSGRLASLAVIRRGTWVVVGAGGLVLRSPDGAWFARGQSGVVHDLHAVVATTDHRVIAVGAKGCVLVSNDDARTWHAMTTPGEPELRSVAATGSGALIGGEAGLLIHLAPDPSAEPEPVVVAPPAPAPKPPPRVARAPSRAPRVDPTPAPIAAAAAGPAPRPAAPAPISAEPAPHPAAPPPIAADPAPAPHVEPARAAPPAPRIDPARANAGLALSRRALALAPDDAEIQLAHAMLLVDVASAGMPSVLDELRARLPTFAPAIRARFEQAVDDQW